MINYPNRPWTDGQTFTYTIDNEVVVGTYRSQKRLDFYSCC